MIAAFSAAARQSVLEHEAAFPGTAGFAAAIDDARGAVGAVAPGFSFTFHLNPNPQAMGADPAVVFPRLLGETEGWIGFIVHSVAYRLGHFLDDVVTGINDARPYRAVGAARSLVELSAFVHHHTKALAAAGTESSQTAPDDFPAAVKGVATALKAATQFAQATRFNWSAMVRGDMDEFFSAWDNVDARVKATQILTLIDRLPGAEKRAARFFYEMLCDYVHPNVAAHTLVVSTAEPMPGGRMRWDLSKQPGSGEALTVLIHAVAIPVRHAVRILLHDLEQLRQLARYFGEWKRRCESLTGRTA